MAKKKKKEVETGRILGRLNDDGSITPFIQKQQEEDIAPVKDTWLKKGALNDSGYAIQNPLDAINRFNASILMTGVDALGQFGKGYLGSAEGVTDIAKTTTADVLDFFGANNKAKKLRESAEKTWGVNEELEKSVASDNGFGIDDMSFLGTKGKSIPQGLASTAFSLTTGTVLGGPAGMAMLGLSAAGNAEQEAIKEMKAYQDVNGFSDKEIYKNAKLYGVLSGTAEALTEMMFGAAAKGSKLLGIGTGVFDEADDAVINALTKRIHNNLIKTFTQAGLKATSEGFEEVASGLLDAFAKKITYQKDKKYWDELVKDENLLDSFLSGTFSAALSQAPGVAKHITTVDENGKLRLKSNNEIKDYITDLSTNEQKIADKVAESRFTEEMTNKEKSKIRKEVMDQLRNLELTSDEINKSLGDEVIQGEPADTLLHQIIQNENTKFNFDEAELQVDNKRVNKNATNVEAKIQQLANDFTNELNDIRNTTSAHKLFNEMKNVIQATGEQVRLTSYNELEKQGAVKLLTDEKGNPIRNKNGRLQYTDEKGNLIGINGFRSKDGIVLNSDSTRLFEATMGHEIGESIKANSQSDYKVLREIATELGKLDGTLTDETMKAIERTYGTLGERTDSYLDEYVNDKLGELFTKDSELINRIGQKPTILRKIIDEVKYLVKRFTTKSAEGKKLLELQHNLENKLQESIRELNVNNKTQEGTQYQLDNQDEKYQSILTNKKEMNLGSYQEGLSKTDKSYRYKKVNSYDIKNGGRGDNVQVAVTKNGYIANNALLSDNVKGKGEGTKIMLDLNQQSLEETGYPLRSLPEYNIVGIKNHTAEGQGLWDSLVRKGFAVKNNDNTYTMLETAPTVEEYVKQRENNTKYSLSPAGEMVDNNGNKVTLEATEEGNSGTLMVLHNLGEDKFNGVLDLGGIPVPSLAVTNPNIIDHNQFGEGTLIFDKSTIDPAVEANEVYDRDVWSPTIRDNVQIDYEINDDAIETTAEKLGIEAWRLRDAVEDNKPEYLAERLLREEKLIDKYVKDNNIKYETAYKDAETKVDMHQRGEKLRKFIIDNDFDFRKLYKDSKLQQEYFDLIKDYYDNSTFPPAVKENLYNEKITQLKDYIDFQKGAGDLEPVRQLKRYQDDFDLIKSGDNKVIDEWQTEKNKKQAAIDNGIEEYLKQQTKNVYGEKGIRNDVELFTNSGNRRSFWALHDEYNLDNLVEALTKGETTGTQHFGSGYGQIQAAMANRFNSISDIKANEGLLTNLSENNEVLENAKANIDSDIEEIESNNDVYYDTVAELLVDFARGDLTVDNFKKLTRNDYQTIRNVSDSLIEKIIDDMETLKNLPTDYFEAKPQRALGLDEIQMAVIPNNWSAETKQRLTDMGIQYTEYNPSIEGDRQRVINQFDDLKFSLSQNNIAPIGNGIRSEQIKPQDIQDAIAPLQEQVQQLTDTITRLEDRIAPLNEQEADELYQETQRGFENEAAPIRENLTSEENQRMDMLELLERNNMMNDERRYEKEQLENKINPVYPTEEATPGQALSDIRDAKEIGSPKIKAYQYEHPEVKPYFQEEARRMLSELNNSTSGSRYVTERTDSMYGDWHGIKRFTSPEIAALLDGEYGAKYQKEDIRKGLNAIIEDHGAENIAVAKRIELVLDERLRNGYDAWGVLDENGEQYHVAPNTEYLNMLAEQEWQNYFDDIANQYPIDDNQVQYALEQEKQQEEQYKIEKSLEEMTADDINLEPFLSGLQGASERQAERQQLREELNQKREVKIPKQSDGRKAWNKFKSLFVNEFAVIDDYAKQTGNKDIKFKADAYNNYQAIAQSNIETAQTDINGKAIGRSGSSIFEEAKKLGLENTFDEYLKQWANVDRAKQGKGVANYSAKESYKIVKEMETKYPVLKRLGNDMWQYYRNARHNLRDAGVINQDVSDMLGRMYPHYTPYISENIENYFTDEGKLKPKATIKRAKGGAAIGSLLSAEEAMQRYTKSEFNTILGNDLYREIVNTSNDIVQLGGDDRGMQFVNADNLYADKNGYYLTAYEDGNPITAKISEDMYETLTRETKNRVNDLANTFSIVTKPLAWLSNVRRNILTSWSPTFIAKNLIKDAQEAIINSKYTKDMVANYSNPKTWIELIKGEGESDIFKNNYGSGLTMGQFDIDLDNYNPNAKNFNFLKGIKNANELIELAPRYAEFKASRQNGCSIQEAMYNAREVTTNFSRGGIITKAFNKYGMTFLNSSVQGFDKFIRNFSGENGAKGIVNSLAKAAIFGIAPAVFNELAFGSGDDKDEEYEALPDYIKDNYYIIKTGDGNFIRIPKGRVLSVFGSAARRTIEAMEGEENAFEGYWNNVQQQIGINNPEENNIFAPLIQAMGGRKLDSGQTAGEAWYGGDIIPSRLQKERPEDQYDASIDKLSIWLGQKTGISPYKINYVLDQYTGGIGDIGLPMITEEANSDGSIIAPIKDQFTADTITDNKYVSEFYDTKGKLYTGSKATDEDVLKNKYMNSISTEMAKLYAERRDIQADDSLTKQQKYAKSQAIKAEINRLAKEGLDNYENIITSNNYAKIGDTEYYKNANGQWTKVTDDVASLGLDTEEKNEYYKVKNDIYTTKKENDGNDKPLVMQDIINSNLTPDAKVNLYTSNYKDDLIQPLVDSGMDVDSYLTYKSQNFTADKDSNGKSISGSKKQKVFDYINSMDVPYEQKLILAKSEYNSFNDNNAEIIEYIENTGMSYDERIELYKALGFKVDGDSISW